MNDVQNAQATAQTETQNPNVSEFTEHFANMQKQVDESTNRLNEFVNSRDREAINKEVTSAAGKINESVGGDAEMAELFLEKQYANNPDLKKVWENRKENPEALETALGVVAEEWKAKNVNMIDPQIAENQKALSESQKTGGTVQATSESAKLDAMSDGEFMTHMRRLNG